MATAFDFGEDFGQKVKLTASIRNILRSYPEGTSILKELIQNADDAAARHVAFCLDHRQHPCELLAAPPMAQFQGPALLAYNDAKFTREDFESIQRLGDSLKRVNSTGTKTGRFGIGFNSVYHLTELPSFLSGKYAVFFDPQARFLPNVNPSNPGKLVNFVDNPTIISTLRDQFSPYVSRTFSCDLTKEYQGTLFRLPLRTQEQAGSSELSQRFHPAETIRELLQELQAEASGMLLFLKRIERISIYEWHTGESNPTVMFECRVNNLSATLRAAREYVATNVHGPTHWQTPLKVDYDLCILSVDEREGNQFEETWAVCNQLGGGVPTVISSNPENAHMKLVPWAGIAGKVSSTTGLTPTNGVAYCFLPLPAKTGLPVNVNGYFELSTNRRDIWHGDDMTGDGRLRSEWNAGLLVDVVGPCYVRLLHRLKRSHSFSEYFQRMWPLGQISSPWRVLQIAALTSMRTEDLLGCSADGEALIWRSPQRVVLCPPASDAYPHDRLSLLPILRSERVPVVDCIEELRQALVDFGCCTEVATPEYLRNHLRLQSPSRLNRRFFSPEQIGFLLGYCSRDLTDAQYHALDGLAVLPLCDHSAGMISAITANQRKLVTDIVTMGFTVKLAVQALRLSEWKYPQAVSLLLEGKPTDSVLDYQVYVLADDKEKSLFKQAQNLFVGTEHIGPEEREKLSSRQFQLTCNVSPMNPELLPDLLCVCLPANWAGRDIVLGVQEYGTLEKKSDEELDTWTWLLHLWVYLCGDSRRITIVSENFPVVPVQGGSVCTLSRRSKLLMGEALPSSLVRSLNQAGINIVAENLLPANVAVPAVLWQYINQPTRAGVLTALGSLTREKDWVATFDGLSEESRVELLTYLACSEPPSALTDAECATIKQLKIFQSHRGADRTSVNLAQSFTCLSGNAYQVLQDEEGLDPLFITSTYLTRRGFHEIELLRRLGVKVINKAQYYWASFLPSLQLLPEELHESRNLSIATMLLSLSQLSRDDKQFLSRLAQLPFVPSAMDSANLCLPSALLDPREPELVEILGPEFFPAKELQAPEILSALRNVGLQTSLTWDGIVKCATSIQTATEQGAENTRRRAQSLLRFLDREAAQLLPSKRSPKKKEGPMGLLGRILGPSKEEEAQRLETEKCLEKLRHIQWVPVLEEPLEPLMPWVGGDSVYGLLCAPHLCAVRSQAWYCSASRSIIAEEVHSEALLHALGWSEDVPSIVLAHQLRGISSLYDEMFRRVEQSDTEAAIQLVQSRQSISAVVPRLYQRLNLAVNADMSEVREYLFNVPWIWVGEKFVKIEQVAFSSPINAVPYLYTVPTDLAVFTNLLESFGVRRSMSASDFRQVLTLMASETGADIPANTRSQIQPLSGTQLEIAISLIQILSDEGTRAGDW